MRLMVVLSLAGLGMLWLGGCDCCKKPAKCPPPQAVEMTALPACPCGQPGVAAFTRQLESGQVQAFCSDKCMGVQAGSFAGPNGKMNVGTGASGLPSFVQPQP